MSSQAASVPREGEILCEHCGYGLTGLPESGLCPECGQPVADSASPSLRIPTPWETPGPPLALRFARTVLAVLLHPHHFFRTLRTRISPDPSQQFSLLAVWISSYFFALAAVSHAHFVYASRSDADDAASLCMIGATLLCPPTAVLTLAVRWLASRLTALEARYRGLRLPEPAVRRTMNYHSAALLPVALTTALLTFPPRLAFASGTLTYNDHAIPYIITLSAWTVLAAIYLFWSYWQAMKSIMWANH